MFQKIIASILSVLSVILTFLGIAHHPLGPQADMSKFTLTFEEEFEGELDRSVWSGHYTWGQTSEIRKGSYWNQYLAKTEDGNLIIPLTYLSEGMGGKGAGWYSAGIDTDSDSPNGFSQKYGYFECRCILPKCAPAWAAFWLMKWAWARPSRPSPPWQPATIWINVQTAPGVKSPGAVYMYPFSK